MTMEYKRMAGPMMLGNSAIRSMDRLAGKRLTQAEIEQALGHKYSPPARTDTERAGGVVQELAAQWRARGISDPKHAVGNADFKAAREEFLRAHPPQPTLYPQAVMEHYIDPQSQQEAEAFYKAVAYDLGLAYWPELRWFGEKASGHRDTYAGWKNVSLITPAANGWYDSRSEEVWVYTRQTLSGIKRTIAHELRHAYQWQRYGASYFSDQALYPESQSEQDARAYAAKAMNLYHRY